jgi:hypothetical protein
MPKAPIFIGGAGRSGSTLLVDLMGCHPQISPVYETSFLRKLFLLFCSLDSPPVEEASTLALQYMDAWTRNLSNRPHNKGAHERYVHGHHHLLFSRELALEATADCVHSICAGSDAAQAIGHLGSRLFSAHAAADSKPRWANKTPVNLNLLPELTRAFGSHLRFVHILRDPRDVACSVVDRPWGPQSHGEVGAWWSQKIGRGLGFAELSSVPYLEVHFEELVQDPVPVLNRVFHFVAEAPLGEQVVAQHRDGRIPFDLSRIGRWRRDFPTSEREAFMAHCGSLMKQVGYHWPSTSKAA